MNNPRPTLPLIPSQYDISLRRRQLDGTELRPLEIVGLPILRN